MPGFCIYAGELKSQASLVNLLQDYEDIKYITFNDENIELLSKISNMIVRPDGVIQFMYSWDEPLHYDYRGTIKHTARTSSLNVRIITGRSHLYFLVEKDTKYNKSKKVLVDISKVIYTSEERIMNAYIVSSLIKELELKNSEKMENKWFKRVSSLDKAVGIYGELDTKNADGTRGQSEVNRTFRKRDQTASRYVSHSNGARVYISASKSSVTLRPIGDSRVGLDDVEQYIRNMILPGIVVDSSR